MTQPVKKSDVHVVAVQTGVDGKPIYGVNIYSILNPTRGVEVERVEGFGAALAAKAKWDAYAKRVGQ